MTRPLVLTAVLVTALLCGEARSQFTHSGLSGRFVYSLATFADRLYAGTDDGVFTLRHALPDTVWQHVGLRGKRVRAVYPHSTGPVSGYAVTAGIDPAAADTTQPLVYCTFDSDTAWVPTDDGINRSEINGIQSVDGFPSPLICGETFAGGYGKVYVRGLTGAWRLALDIGIGMTNVVRVSPVAATVWTGGETGIFAPYVARSDDRGTSWDVFSPWMGGDNACNSLAMDPSDTAVVYAGMEGAVIRTTDGGTTWESTGLEMTPYYMYALWLDGIGRRLYAGGSTNTGLPGFFVLDLAGGTWAEITPTFPFAGIRTMAVAPTAIPEQWVIYLGTVGEGVIRYVPPLTGVTDPPAPDGPALFQNYPNPFNGSTRVRFTVPMTAHVELAVYTLLAQRVATLVNGVLDRGTHTRIWDASAVASGVYVCRMTAAGSVRQQRMTYLR